jgi:signal transduction histidine kinase
MEVLGVSRRLRTTLLGLFLALEAIPSAAADREPPPPPWRVLILYDGPRENPAAVVATEALLSALSEGASPRLVDIRSEVLDALSFDAAFLEPEVLALLRKKGYAGHLDLVMPIGGTGREFALRHREELWPGVPIVSFGDFPAARGEDSTGDAMTQIEFEVDEVGTLRLARRLQPDAERLVLVAGGAEYDRKGWARLRAAAAREGNGLEIESLLGRPLAVVLDRVSRLRPRSIVLYTTMSRDTDGQALTPAHVAEQLSRASTAPVYGVWESQLGRGIVGGSMESLAEHGRRAAAVALRVLRGESPDSIRSTASGTFVPIVDWRQLRRFGLSEASLPAGSVVRYRPPSLVREHPNLALAVGLALALQAGLIAALLAQARQRRRAESEGARQRASLAHAARLSAVGELTASIAHEINQPLGAILSNAEAAEIYLESDPPRLDQVRRILGDIREEDHRASAVIRQVRALSRKQSPGARPLDLNEVVADVMALVGADGNRRGVEVETDLAPRLPPVIGDRIQLQQVVLNLAMNALDAVGPPGPGRRNVLIRTRAAGGGVELAVSDTGSGFAQEHHSRLFESFFTTKSEGLGLGLSIVRSIVEAHGGQVAAENNDGGGATFRIRLPAARGNV